MSLTRDDSSNIHVFILSQCSPVGSFETKSTCWREDLRFITNMDQRRGVYRTARLVLPCFFFSFLFVLSFCHFSLAFSQACFNLTFIPSHFSNTNKLDLHFLYQMVLLQFNSLDYPKT